MRCGGIKTLRVSTLKGPSTFFAGANCGRPSSSICISASFVVATGVGVEVASMFALLAVSIKRSSSSVPDLVFEVYR